MVGLMVLVVFGPSGSGKTTVGRALAERLGWRFLEGDAFHPPGNVARMRAGEGLDDTQRDPWLAALAREIATSLADRRHAVLACSALKRSYRQRLLPPDARAGDVRFVYLDASPALLAERLRHRDAHFFPATLLDTQLETLEEPGQAEPAPVLAVDASQPVDALVDAIVASLPAAG
jgi:carbohydrate kinase (thermoresistant glucokinase family)